MKLNSEGIAGLRILGFASTIAHVKVIKLRNLKYHSRIPPTKRLEILKVIDISLVLHMVQTLCHYSVTEQS